MNRSLTMQSKALQKAQEAEREWRQARQRGDRVAAAEAWSRRGRARRFARRVVIPGALAA